MSQMEKLKIILTYFLVKRASCPKSGLASQQKQDIEPLLVQWWTNVVDGGPTLNQQ